MHAEHELERRDGIGYNDQTPKKRRIGRNKGFDNIWLAGEFLASLVPAFDEADDAETEQVPRNIPFAFASGS